MHDTPGPLADRRTGWRGIARGAALAFVVLAVVLPGAATLGTSPPKGLSAPVAPVDQLALQAATASLATSAGPSAAYGPCAVTLGTQVSCGPSLVPHPLTGNGTYAPKSWTDISTYAGTGPSPRWLGGMTYDPVDKYVLLFGGYDTADYSDTWSFANSTWTALSPTNSPAGRYAMGLTWDVADGYAVLFGGYAALAPGSPAYNDTWTFVHGQWTNVTPATPTPSNNPADRWRMGLTWDGADSYVLMFGGTNNVGSTIYSDTWSFSAGTWTKLNVSGSPPGRYRASMTYDAVDGYVVLFGGCTSTSCPDSSTWVYANLTWTHLTPSSHPSSRVYYGITYSTVFDRVLLFGGDTSVAGATGGQSDTWAFTGGDWTDLTSNLSRSPPAVSYMMMSFDPLDNLTIMFGGEWTNSSFSGTTWALGPSILGRLTLSSTAIDKGESFNVNATPISYSKWVGYNYTVLPPGCASLNVSVLTCQPSTTGRFPISVVLNDSDGSVVTESTNVTVNPVPSLQSFSVSPTTVTRGSPAHFAAVGLNGTLPYSFKYAGLPPGCNSANTATLTCTPGPTAFGPYIVQVTLTDAANENQSTTTDLSVNPQPSFTSFVARPGILDVGQTLNLYANATGGTGPFTFNYSGLPAGCSSVNASVLTCQPTSTGTGFHPVQVQIVDAFNWSATIMTNITVNPDPIITAASATPSLVDVGTAVNIQVTASGGSGLLSYSYSTGPPGCSFGNHSTVTCTPSSAGTWHINATVTDGAGFAVTTTAVLVVNPPLTFVQLNATPAAVDANQNVTLGFEFTGGTAPIAITWGGLPTGCLATANSATLTCAPRNAGTAAISATATDLFKQVATGSVQLIVYADPTISSISAGSGSITVGSATTVSVTTSGGSGGYSFSYTGLPAGCTSENTSTLHCTPTATGTFNITVTATDSNGKSTTGSVLLVVNSASSSSGSGGSLLLYGLIGAVVVILVVAVVLLMGRRRRTRTPAPAAEWAEEAPAEEAEPR